MIQSLSAKEIAESAHATHKTFKFRIYPTAEQECLLRQWQGTLRFLWNLALEQYKIGMSRPRGERVYPTAFGQCAELTVLRAEHPWIASVPRDCAVALLRRLETSWRRCFDGIGSAPRWKRRDSGQVSICEPHAYGWRIGPDGLTFIKLGTLRVVQHRELQGVPKSCSLITDGDQWFANIVCAVPNKSAPSPRHEPRVALDRGVVNLTADSDGKLTESPRFFHHTRALLARAQRNVSRKQKGSKNQAKAKLRVARLHRKVRRQREHVIHTLSAAYAKSHGTVVVEKLNTLGMVRANRGLARSILDSGWGKLVACLKYKLAWTGGQLLEVPAAYSSQTCSACGVVDCKSRRSQSGFICTSCGHVDHADLNAAKVLLSRANRSALPVEGTVPEAARRSRKRQKGRCPEGSDYPTSQAKGD